VRNPDAAGRLIVVVVIRRGGVSEPGNSAGASVPGTARGA
jgi:hypothetical protein